MGKKPDQAVRNEYIAVSSIENLQEALDELLEKGEKIAKLIINGHGLAGILKDPDRNNELLTVSSFSVGESEKLRFAASQYLSAEKWQLSEFEAWRVFAGIRGRFIDGALFFSDGCNLFSKDKSIAKNQALALSRYLALRMVLFTETGHQLI